MIINPIVGVYIPIIRIPIKRWDDHPQKNATFDHGTNVGKHTIPESYGNLRDAFKRGPELTLNESYECTALKHNMDIIQNDSF